MEDLICKRQGCEKLAAKGQVYCSRECSPYGMMFYRKSSPKKDRVKKSKIDVSRLRELADSGMPAKVIAVELKVSEVTIRNYARKFSITLKRPI